MRRLIALALCLVLLASTWSPASSQSTPELDDISAEYHDLLDLFYRPIAPADLLNAGWLALGSDANRHGVAPPAPLPDLPADADGAFAIFSGAYSSYVASLPQSFTPDVAAVDIETAMAESLNEQHTNYLSASVLRQFLATVGGGQSSIGLGIKFGGDPAGLITDVAPGGPAASAGIQPGDVIVAVDGTNVSTSDRRSLLSALGGPDGSTVDLAIDRGNGPQSFQITRGSFYFPPLESSLVAGGVGYLRLTDFVISGTNLPNGTELLADLDQALSDLDAQGAQGLVLDLRNNGGGSVQTADEILGRFLPDNVRSVRESDQRGHETFELAAGRVHARQLPMAVLINGGSASASEMTAAALRDEHRAILVGQKTAGAVASSELLPLPSGSGIQVAVAAATTPDSNSPLDGVGVTPDVVMAQGRTVDDYRSGRDPQLDAAVAALANAPTPPSVTPDVPPLSPAGLDQLLGSALPDENEMPTNDRLTSAPRWQRLDYLHPNELIDQNGGSTDPVGLQQTLRSRGYQGSVMATYGPMAGNLPAVSVNADVYATADGAHASTTTNDLPEMQESITPVIQLGDETVSYRGAWLATGSTLLVWRRGRVVYTVTYSDVPGFERPDTLSAIAQLVDAHAQQLTIP